MTKLRKFEITLNNPQVVYFPGQVIQGQVIVELSDDMKMRGIRVKCRGKGHVYWSTGSGDNRRTYSASEDYVDVVLVLFGNGSSTII
ncbi:arrestin domain-containing protein 17-like [Mercenaria mercenaria]|uniref:arrestin domain-containing protein 17-like n=1 Tax=Mercenaria mercenaria TaxID=6596 RepID=UPI00234F38F5|nr:arrestin domain-containing protein 17-like [Mercenaria mercenaria]